MKKIKVYNHKTLAVSQKTLKLLKKYKKDNCLKNMDKVIKELIDKAKELDYLHCEMYDCPICLESGY